MAGRLNRSDYMRFPLTIGADGAELSDRLQHIREVIEQVLYTNPGERWFRPEFGAGAQALVFEPNTRPLWEVVKKRIHASLSEALAGEVEPESLDVSVDEPASTDGRLVVSIAYTLAALNHSERQRFAIGGSP